MKKILIICAAGISSSLVAKKATEYFKSHQYAGTVHAASVIVGSRSIAHDNYDLFLVSPQTRQYYAELSQIALKHGKRIENLPAQAYVANQQGIEILCTMIENLLNEDYV